jgi:hypothetical protein
MSKLFTIFGKNGQPSDLLDLEEVLALDLADEFGAPAEIPASVQFAIDDEAYTDLARFA